jgi:hypothetical protein
MTAWSGTHSNSSFPGVWQRRRLQQASRLANSVHLVQGALKHVKLGCVDYLSGAHHPEADLLAAGGKVQAGQAAGWRRRHNGRPGGAV